ncbi:MAG TPA: double zinc ribbon domain-containing protein [Candidatus Edwardsbacteria bacterium]|nr:double zinc ribbon domain-containing protein [Candidatus Edwardsbacteria bacterium]
MEIRPALSIDPRLSRHVGPLLDSLVDFVFPPFCAACRRRMPGRERGAICPDCWQAYRRWPEGSCQRCGQPLPEAPLPKDLAANQDEVLCQRCRIPGWSCAAVRTPGPFEKPVADAVHLLKYSDRRAVAATLAGLMAAAAGADPRYRRADLVLAVPLHGARQRERGYNQAQLLAAEVGRIMGKPCPERVLARIRHTGSQTKLDREQRQDNVRDIFAVRRPARVQGATVILVDDVLTTGATIGSCGQALLRAGAAQVLALTAAAAPLA